MTSFKEFISEKTEAINEGLYAEQPYDLISTNCFGYNLWKDFIKEIEESYKGLSLSMSLDGRDLTHKGRFSADKLEMKEKFVKEMLEDGGKKFSSLWTDYCQKFFKIKNLKIEIRIFDVKERDFKFEMDIHINTTIKYTRG